MLAFIGLYLLFSSRIYICNLLKSVLDTLSGIFFSSRKVIILRGLPGSGKSSFIENYIQEKRVKNYSICCANDYFVQGKKYNFNPRKLPQAYSDCLTDYIDSLINKETVIFINNPNSLTWEYDNYIRLAIEFGYEYEIFEMNCPHEKYVQLFKERCAYKVNYQTCKSIYDRWEDEPGARIIFPDDDSLEIENITCFDGDSLPYPPKTLEELDDELDTIASKLRELNPVRRSLRLNSKIKTV